MGQRILCLIGFHTWTWRLEEGEKVIINKLPPDHAKCAYCGAIYREAKTP